MQKFCVWSCSKHLGLAAGRIWTLCWEEENELKQGRGGVANLRKVRLDTENRLVVVKAEGVGEGWSVSLGFTDANYYIENG